jgi:hypothetical protein
MTDRVRRLTRSIGDRDSEIGVLSNLAPAYSVTLSSDGEMYFPAAFLISA